MEVMRGEVKRENLEKGNVGCGQQYKILRGKDRVEKKDP